MQRRHFIQAGLFALAPIVGCSALVRTSRLDAAQFRSERRFARTSFGRIAYVERGSGNAALFLHGFPLNSFQWRGQLERLSPMGVEPEKYGMRVVRSAPWSTVLEWELDPRARAERLIKLSRRDRWQPAP